MIFYNKIIKLILKRFFLLLIFFTLIFAVILLIPQYAYFSINKFIMFSNFNDLFLHFLYKIPRCISDSFFIATIVALFNLFLYLNNKNIKKRILLTGINFKFYLNFIFIINIILIISNFYFNENISIKYDYKANNLLYKDWMGVSHNPRIFIYKKSIIFLNDYKTDKDSTIFKEIVIDKLDENRLKIITAKIGYFDNDYLILKDCVENIITTRSTSNNYDELVLDYFSKQNNVLDKKISFLSLNDINKIIKHNKFSNIYYMDLIKISRHLSLFNKIFILAIILYILSNLSIKNVLHANYISIILILFFLLYENNIMKYFLKYSIKSSIYIFIYIFITIILGFILYFVFKKILFDINVKEKKLFLIFSKLKSNKISRGIFL